jgi:hypothetical protein
MTDGMNLTGFNETQAGATNNLDLNPTGQTPAAAFPAADMSQQGPSGTTNKMVHTAAETSTFGTGN